MTRGATYVGLLAALRQEELLGESMRRRRATNVIRRRRHSSIAARLRHAVRIPRA